MKTKDLAKLYDQLTPRERLPLIIAAGERGDEVEQKHLCASAPKETFQVPNYHHLARGLIEAGHYHLLTLLDLAAQYWQWWGLWMTYGLRDQENAGADKSQRKNAKGAPAALFVTTLLGSWPMSTAGRNSARNYRSTRRCNLIS